MNNHQEVLKQNRQIHAAYRKKIRNDMIKALGGKCARCGFSDERALQIDHVNGDGLKERKERKNNLIRLYRKIMEKSSAFQLLCANCNWIKRAENNENRQFPIGY